MSVLVRNGRIVTATDDYQADLLIEDSIVAAIGRGLKVEADTILDASGLLVLPGGVDAHTHIDMPFGGTVTSDDFETGPRAAAFGGTTTLIDFAIQARGQSMRTALDTWFTK
ncbi:MAG: dihydropyrimidinase, partial [Acidobacteria bacterium]